MSIKALRVSNFKAFEDLSIDALGNFSVMIGANASGKSSVVEVFRFLRDIANHGLPDAISMQGGVEYLRNVKLQSNRLTVEVDFESPSGFIVQKGDRLIGIRSLASKYCFELELQSEAQSVRVVKDFAEFDCDVVELTRTENDNLEESGLLGHGSVEFQNTDGKITPHLRFDNSVPFGVEDVLVRPYGEDEEMRPALLLERSSRIPFWSFDECFTNISIYDFGAGSSKKAVPITGKSELAEDGSNLPIVLKKLISDPRKKSRLLNLLRDLLPFVNDLDVKHMGDQFLLLNVCEDYAPNTYFPSFLLSDGTMGVMFLLVALCFSGGQFVVIEEPERSIHPSLICKVVQAIQNASAEKQIIITTHSPEVVKHVPLDDLLLVSRRQNGFSMISRPAARKELATFLENDIGVDELYIQNLLGE
jgi:predicted ATPase